MKKLLIAATALSGLLAFNGSALAADPFVDMSYDWSGFYVGGFIGAMDLHSTVSDDTPATGFFDNNGGESSIKASKTGIFGGATLGYNFQADYLVMGLEGELGFAGVKARRLSLADGNNGDSHEADYGLYGLGAARLGVAVDRFLPYIKGGVAFADADYRGGDIDPGPVFDPLYSYKKSKTRVGFAVGGGLEYAMTDSISLKAEYMYIDFGHISVVDGGGRSYSIKDNAHTFKLGMNFSF